MKSITTLNLGVYNSLLIIKHSKLDSHANTGFIFEVEELCLLNPYNMLSLQVTYKLGVFTCVLLTECHSKFTCALIKREAVWFWNLVIYLTCNSPPQRLRGPKLCVLFVLRVLAWICLILSL